MMNSVNNKAQKNFFTHAQSLYQSIVSRKRRQHSVRVKSWFFTLHLLITTYLYDSKIKNSMVNRVNNYTQKRILMVFNIVPVWIRVTEPNRDKPYSAFLMYIPRGCEW